MASKREPTGDERELFETALADAVPLKAQPRRPRKSAAPKSRAAKPPPQTPPETPRPAQIPTRRTAGIDGNTADRLRRGLLEPQARLDLHGLSEHAAHAALVTFVRGAKLRRLRLVLIVTGKGASRKNEREEPFDLGLDMRMRGILRSMTPRWLAEPGLAEFVADVREAHRRHGGGGALYVYLRKG
ncbi:MAG TPA: Smr/MutS family protein [Rhizomicrobium sp.]|jgi:DNA-nicking Smr family endonuclease